MALHMMASIPFVLVARQRSGSTWLADLLNNHPSIKMFGELFLWRVRSADIRLDEFPGYYDYASQMRFVIRPVSIFRYLDRFYLQQEKAVGFKLMYSQFRHFPEVLLYLRLRKIPVIYLVRQNYLDSVISLETAFTRGRFHSDRAADLSANNAIYLEPAATLRKIIRQERQHKLVKLTLRLLGLDYCSVNYENLCADTRSTLAEILAFLNLEPLDMALQSQFRKLVTKSHRDGIANYDELKRVLSNTRYIDLLKD
jgi:LPS sulfotransferase NodH